MDGYEYSYKCPNHTGNLNNARLHDMWCDVTIRVNGKELRAHKVILGSNLKYFQTMFSNDSFQENKENVVTMKNIDREDLEALVSYAYTGEILLTKSNALRLLVTANYLSEDGIKEACVEFLKKHLREKDACRAYQFANTINCLELKNAAKTKIMTNFGDCSLTSEYLTLDYESLIDILVDGKRQSAEIQQKFFEGIMRWIMHDGNKRKIHVENLLNSISLTKLTAEYLMYYLGNEAYRVDEHGIIKDILICYHTSIIEQKKQEQVLMIVGNTANAKFHFQFYNFTKKKWSPLQEIPNTDGNNYSNSAVLRDQLYFISRNSGKYDLQRFDPATKKNITLRSSNILKWSTLCACSRFVYLCGGVREDDSKTDQVLRYDPQTNTFELLTPMQVKRKYPAAIFYQDSLHVLGGSGDDSVHNTVEKYDAATQTWTSLPLMRESRYAFGVAVASGKLYAYGGESKNSVEVYDPEKNSWQLVARMNKSRIHFLTFARESKLLAIGGNHESTAEVYDPSKDQWQMDHNLLSGLQVYYPRGGLISGNCVHGDE